TDEFFRRFRCNGFDFNSDFSAGDNYRRGCGSIEQYGKINLARNVSGLGDEHFVYCATARPGLVSDQNLTEHFRCDIAHFRWRLADMHSALESVRERTLATSASVNLRFNDNLNIAQLACDLLRLVECRRDPAPGSSYVEFLQQFFVLVFVDVHRQGAAVQSAAFRFQKAIAIACRRQIGKDFSTVNWLASRKPNRLRWRP